MKMEEQSFFYVEVCLTASWWLKYYMLIFLLLYCNFSLCLLTEQ